MDTKAGPSCNTSKTSCKENKEDNVKSNSSKQEVSEEHSKIISKYWELTERKRQPMLKEKEFGPNQYHEWGKLNFIKENSPTLKHVIQTDPEMINIPEKKPVFEKILNELGIDYNIVECPSWTKDKIISYNLRSTPKLTFLGSSLNIATAEESAAMKGLEFMIMLA